MMLIKYTRTGVHDKEIIFRSVIMLDNCSKLIIIIRFSVVSSDLVHSKFPVFRKKITFKINCVFG